MGEVLPLINYYAREGYFRHIGTLCSDTARKRGNSPELGFWRAFSLAGEGDTSAAIREYDQVRRLRRLLRPHPGPARRALWPAG